MSTLVASQEKPQIKPIARFFSFLLHFCIHFFCIHCHPLVVPGSHLLMPTPPLSPAKSPSIEEPGPCHLSCPCPCEVQGFREPLTFPPPSTSKWAVVGCRGKVTAFVVRATWVLMLIGFVNIDLPSFHLHSLHL